jgi:DNA-binding XRE family transcriptional regulator
MADVVLDEWKIALKNKRAELEACQNSHSLSSCLKCEKLLNCTIRDIYIKAVYDSMSKGKGGGFEF